MFKKCFRSRELVCEAIGGRPKPTFTWWKVNFIIIIIIKILFLIMIMIIVIMITFRIMINELSQSPFFI